MGYPCYVPSSSDWVELTVSGVGREVRQYVSFITTTCLCPLFPWIHDARTDMRLAVLLVLAIVTIAIRYKGHNGKLVQVLRRDGGAYYLALAGQLDTLIQIVGQDS